MYQLTDYHQGLDLLSLPYYWGQLIQTRDTLFSALVCELTLNKILLENTMMHKSSSSKGTKSSSGSQQGPNQQNQAQQLQKKKIQEPDIQSKEGNISKKDHNFASQMKNDTKNIPKNYGKAILSFIQKFPKSKEIVESFDIKYTDFLMHIRRLRKKVNSIEGLKKMWGAGNINHKMKKCIRILSYIFMRKHCLPYIFHSKVRNFTTHIKYRSKLIQGIEDPDQFNHIKQY